MRLIDADLLKSDHNMGDECNKCKTKWRECQYDYIYSKMDFCTWIDDAPTIDAVEVVHGEWVGVHEYIDHLEKVTGEKFQISNLYDGCNFCNNCWYSFPRKYNYCPNCGANMDGKRIEK